MLCVLDFCTVDVQDRLLLDRLLGSRTYLVVGLEIRGCRPLSDLIVFLFLVNY